MDQAARAKKPANHRQPGGAHAADSAGAGDAVLDRQATRHRRWRPGPARRRRLAGQEAEWTIKKGAVWWFSNRVRVGEAQTVLRAVVPAEFA